MYFDSITEERDANDEGFLKEPISIESVCQIIWKSHRLKVSPEEIKIHGFHDAQSGIGESGLFTIGLLARDIQTGNHLEIKLWVVPTV